MQRILVGTAAAKMIQYFIKKKKKYRPPVRLA